MARRKMNAREFLADVRMGMDDTGLIEKYRLSEDLLQGVLEKLLSRGLLTRKDLRKRTLMSEKSVAVVWECPACGVPQTQVYDECPRCGVIAAKVKTSLTPVWDFWES